MGQQNEIEDASNLLKQLNLYEEQLKNDGIFIEDSYLIAKNIAKEYLACKSLLDEYQKKKQTKNTKEINDYRNKLDEINHKIDRINKWVKMAKTPFKNNFQMFLNKIKGDDKKIKNKLYQDKSTDNIFRKGVRKKDNKLENNLFEQDKTSEITIKKSKRKKVSSLDKYKNKESENDNNDKVIQIYSDKSIEEKIIEFYANNKSKFRERIFKGPPESFRWLSWCIINEIPLERDINIYNNYLVKDLEEENKNAIIRDIQRTFSDASIDKAELRKKETSLYNVLKAFWNLDNQLGYCQGMNLLVGFMLLISEGNELDTFYLLISSFSSTFIKRKAYDYSLRGLFSEEFPLLAFFNFIFDILLEENIPEIKSHLDELGITYDLWIGQWFQTLFTIILPLNWCKRVWDCIFSEGVFFLVKFGLVFTKKLKSDILEKEEEIDVINFFKEMQKFSMCPENEFLNNKTDINTLIIKANKVKLDPEEYAKIYKKRNENYNMFKMEMEKNNSMKYPLERGNTRWNDYRINNRATILFEKEEKENEKEGVSLDQIEELYGEEDNNIIEQENLNIGKVKKNSDNIKYDPSTKKISIKISKKQSDNENKNEIKIKPILQRKNNINTNKKMFVPKAEIFFNENNINNIFDKNEEEKKKNNIIYDNNINQLPYKKKKMNKIPNKNNEDNLNKNQIKIKKNIDINNINNNISNQYNPKKYYNVNLDNDNKNLDFYYANKIK